MFSTIFLTTLVICFAFGNGKETQPSLAVTTQKEPVITSIRNVLTSAYGVADSISRAIIEASRKPNFPLASSKTSIKYIEPNSFDLTLVNLRTTTVQMYSNIKIRLILPFPFNILFSPFEKALKSFKKETPPSLEMIVMKTSLEKAVEAAKSSERFMQQIERNLRPVGEFLEELTSITGNNKSEKSFDIINQAFNHIKQFETESPKLTKLYSSMAAQVEALQNSLNELQEGKLTVDEFRRKVDPAVNMLKFGQDLRSGYERIVKLAADAVAAGKLPWEMRKETEDDRQREELILNKKAKEMETTIDNIIRDLKSKYEKV